MGALLALPHFTKAFPDEARTAISVTNVWQTTNPYLHVISGDREDL